MKIYNCSHDIFLTSKNLYCISQRLFNKFQRGAISCTKSYHSFSFPMQFISKQSWVQRLSVQPRLPTAWPRLYKETNFMIELPEQIEFISQFFRKSLVHEPRNFFHCGKFSYVIVTNQVRSKWAILILD